jgi:Transglycosylase
MRSAAASRRRLQWFISDHPRVAWILGVLLAALVTYPFWAGLLAEKVVCSQLSSRLGVPVKVRRAWGGLGDIKLYGLVVGEGRPLLEIEKLEIPFAAAWGGGTVVAQGPRVEIHHGGPRDNVSSVLAKLRGKKGEAAPARTGSARKVPAVIVRDGTVQVVDAAKAAVIVIGSVNAQVFPGRTMKVELREIAGRVRVRGGENDPSFGAAALEIEGAMEGLKPALYPQVRMIDGFLRPLPTLPLTGIQALLRPGSRKAGAAAVPLEIEMSGSYGGARRSLWTAHGSATLTDGVVDGTLALRAERFTLDKIADILPAQVVLQPEKTNIDAAMDLTFSKNRVGFSGNLEVSGLNVHHEKLASEALYGLAFALHMDGALDPDRRRLEIGRFEGRIGDLIGRISGAVELAPGSFQYDDGSQMPSLPKIELRVQVPKISCAKLLTSIPGPVVPRLQGFVMTGNFEADLRTKIDYSNLEALELGGKVGIDGCKVTKAPDEILKLVGPDSIIQVVDVPPKLGGGTIPETYMFPIGPDNPDFVPFDKISPHLVNSIMTTEDNGFFKHHGFVTPEFKSALRRNLSAGRFRFGASSISMQMVKNVLLAHEKTLSRKLQELFLVWYVEQLLPKQRILELYFNAIEFGPRLYGIGPAARHYFGKSATDLGPLEAAFFSSILPSPKRRYVQYCAGALNAKWDKYVRRIMAKTHERGRLSDEEYDAAQTTPFAFDITERGLTEKQCMDWVKQMTARPEPEPEPEAESP